MTIDPLRLKALARFKNKQWLKGEKADIQMGGLERITPKDEVIKCEICNRKVYIFDKFEDISDFIDEDRLILCPICVMTTPRFAEGLTDEQKVMLLNLYGKEIMKKQDEIEMQKLQKRNG